MGAGSSSVTPAAAAAAGSTPGHGRVSRGSLSGLKQQLRSLLQACGGTEPDATATAVDLLLAVAGKGWSDAELVEYVAAKGPDHVLLAKDSVGLAGITLTDLIGADVQALLTCCQLIKPAARQHGRVRGGRTDQLSTALCELLAYIFTGEDPRVLLLPCNVHTSLVDWQDYGMEEELARAMLAVGGICQLEQQQPISIFVYDRIFFFVQQSQHWRLLEAQPPTGLAIAYDSLCGSSGGGGSKGGSSGGSSSSSSRISGLGRDSGADSVSSYMSSRRQGASLATVRRQQLPPLIAWLDHEADFASKPRAEQTQWLAGVLPHKAGTKGQGKVVRSAPAPLSWPAKVATIDRCLVADVLQQQDGISCGVHALCTLHELVQKGKPDASATLKGRRHLLVSVVKALVMLGAHLSGPAS
jgi:hypothetical protein